MGSRRSTDKRGIAKPHRTVISTKYQNREQEQINSLLAALKQQLIQELTIEISKDVLKTV